MKTKQIRAPYKPILESTDDTKHFDPQICEIPIESPQRLSGKVGESVLGEVENTNDFEGFSFEAHTYNSAHESDV
jgi:hypothetical protein